MSSFWSSSRGAGGPSDETGGLPELVTSSLASASWCGCGQLQRLKKCIQRGTKRDHELTSGCNGRALFLSRSGHQEELESGLSVDRNREHDTGGPQADRARELRDRRGLSPFIQTARPRFDGKVRLHRLGSERVLEELQRRKYPRCEQCDC